MSMTKPQLTRSSTKPCPCPICSTDAAFLRSVTRPLVECIRRHKFYVEWGKVTDRVLVLAVDSDGHAKGERSQVPDEVTF